jgi:hypothetical protein
MVSASCLYVGKVRHRRYAPSQNSFTYTLYMSYLDLDELESVFRGRLLWSTKGPNLSWLRRADHLRHSEKPFKVAVQDLVEKRTGKRPAGPIRLLTHLRQFGFVFNPVSFYFCWDPSDSYVETIVSEVHNTPWLEQYCYVHQRDSANLESTQGKHRYQFGKDFHVSPFMPMDVSYDWRFADPGKSLAIHMENYRQGEKFFDATLSMQRREITTGSLAEALVHFPFMTGKVSALIYLQALKLWWKGTPFYTHPKKLESKP